MLLDAEEYRRWSAAADDALAGAQAQVRAGLYQWACFLAEQSAQLAVKALLHGVGAGAWGHDLTVLGEKVESVSEGPLPSELSAALRRLSRHYIPARYPDAHPSGTPGAHYGAQDAADAQDDAAAVRRFVHESWQRLSEGGS